MNDITLGQYFPGSSMIHRLDPRIKIFLSSIIMISVFMCWNYVSMSIVAAFIILTILISGIPVKTYFNSVKFILLFTAISAILNLFYGEGEPLFKIGFLSITEYGIRSAIVVIFRISVLIIAGSSLMFTTSPNDMTYAIEGILSPLKHFNINTQDMSMMMTIALRFIPTLMEESNKIIKAQKSRGADMYSGNIITRIKSFIPILFPLFISAFRRAYELALAMECRCYSSLSNRTHMKEFKITGLDIAAVIVSMIYLIGVMLCSLTFGIKI